MNTTRKPKHPAPAPAPIGGLMDARFVYIKSDQTDLKATFARVRAEMAAGKRSL